MAFIMRFTPTGMTFDAYNTVIQQLEQAGAGAPAGRRYHVCFGDPTNLRVSAIWESVEDFEKFGQTLRPILKKLGIDLGQPEVIPIHNIIKG